MPGTTNSVAVNYPMTSMNFVVTAGEGAVAAFSEISGIEASVDVVEFRQGNAPSLAPMKIPGLVHHGNVTMKYGYILGDAFRSWVAQCVSSERGAANANSFRRDVRVELLDTGGGKAMEDAINTNAAEAGGNVWVFRDAWITKYNGPDMNAMNSEVAVESIELAYESLIISGNAAVAPAGGGGAAPTT